MRAHRCGREVVTVWKGAALEPSFIDSCSVVRGLERAEVGRMHGWVLWLRLLRAAFAADRLGGSSPAGAEAGRERFWWNGFR